MTPLPALFRSARRQYVKYDIQGRINSFTTDVGKDAPYLAEHRVEVQWVDANVDRQAFLREGKVVLRLRTVDPDDMNFVRGAYMFVSTSLLHKAKRYIAPSHRDAIDLFVTTKIIEREKANIVSMFLDEYLHPRTLDPESKITKYFDIFDRMRHAGLFYAVFLQELEFLGDKVFGQRKDEAILQEVNKLIEFLDGVASRTLGSEGDLEFAGGYCRFAIVIVGKKLKLTPEGETWSRYILKSLEPQDMETLYVVGHWENREILDSVASSLAEHFDVFRRRHGKVQLYRSGGAPVQLEQYLVVLRRKSIEVFKPSERSAE